ncbi:hypothetical protein CLOM_g391 [Closterium sp. NIES-68]|nr:hypothetical protein CLOM_g391 [Closterium sp. NIES-68]
MERTGARNGSDGVSSTSIRKRGGKNHHNHRSNSSSSESSSGKWWTSSSRSRSIRNSRRMKRRRSAGAGAGGAGGGDGGRSKFNSSLRRASSRSSGRGKRVLRRLLHEADTEVTLKSTQESALTQLLGAAGTKEAGEGSESWRKGSTGKGGRSNIETAESPLPLLPGSWEEALSALFPSITILYRPPSWLQQSQQAYASIARSMGGDSVREGDMEAGGAERCGTGERRRGMFSHGMLM